MSEQETLFERLARERNITVEEMREQIMPFKYGKAFKRDMRKSIDTVSE